MDAQTLEYMGKRVDEARKLTERIAKLKTLLAILDECTGFRLTLFYTNGTHHLVKGELGGKDDALLADEVTATASKRVSVTRDRLADELNQL